jgi:hypothetical protein
MISEDTTEYFKDAINYASEFVSISDEPPTLGKQVLFIIITLLLYMGGITMLWCMRQTFKEGEEHNKTYERNKEKIDSNKIALAYFSERTHQLAFLGGMSAFSGIMMLFFAVSFTIFMIYFYVTEYYFGYAELDL